MDANPAVTVDDRCVETLANALVRLPNYDDGPTLGAAEMPTYMSGGEWPRTDDGYIDADVVREDVADTTYGQHLHGLTEWAEQAAPHVETVVDWDEHATGETSDSPNVNESPNATMGVGRRLSLSLWPDDRPSYAAYHCRVDYWFDGTFSVRLAVFPDGTADLDPTAWDEVPWEYRGIDSPLSDVDVPERVDQLDQCRPYVTSRVAELTEECGFSDGQAHVQALQEAGLDDDAIAKRRGVKDARSTRTRAKQAAEEAERAFLATGGSVPRRILSSAAVNEPGQYEALDKRMYVCVPSWYASAASPHLDDDPESARDAPGAWLITVSNMSEESEEWGLSVDVDPYGSFRALCRDLIRNSITYETQQRGGSHWGQLLSTLPPAYEYLVERVRGQVWHDRDGPKTSPPEWWA
jgi:hypothetical protein